MIKETKCGSGWVKENKKKHWTNRTEGILKEIVYASLSVYHTLQFHNLIMTNCF